MPGHQAVVVPTGRGTWGGIDRFGQVRAQAALATLRAAGLSGLGATADPVACIAVANGPYDQTRIAEYSACHSAVINEIVRLTQIKQNQRQLTADEAKLQTSLVAARDALDKKRNKALESSQQLVPNLLDQFNAAANAAIDLAKRAGVSGSIDPFGVTGGSQGLFNAAMQHYSAASAIYLRYEKEVGPPLSSMTAKLAAVKQALNIELKTDSARQQSIIDATKKLQAIVQGSPICLWINERLPIEWAWDCQTGNVTLSGKLALAAAGGIVVLAVLAPYFKAASKVVSAVAGPITSAVATNPKRRKRWKRQAR